MFENKNLGFIESPERPLRLFMQTSTSHQTNQVSTIKDNQDWSSSYKTFLASSNLNASSVECINHNIERLFLIFWENKAFEKAIEFIISMTSQENLLPTQVILKNLFISMMIGEERFSRYLYNSIYAYILNLILNNPPVSEELVRYYRGIFKKFEILVLFRLVLFLLG